MKRPLTALLPLALFAATANAATYYTNQTTGSIGNIAGYTDWDDNPTGPGNAPGSYPPAAGNTDTWVIQGGAVANFFGGTWHGGTTRFDKLSDTDIALLMVRGDTGGDAIVQDVTLNGGGLKSNGPAVYGDTLMITAVGGKAGVEGGSGFRIDFNRMTGTGTIEIIPIFGQGVAPGSSSSGVTFAVDDFSGFTGTFLVSDTQKLLFGSDVETASFGLEVQVDGNHAYRLHNNVSVTSAKFGGTTLDPGTYDAAALTGLGLGGYFTDDGGTLTVVSQSAPLRLTISRNSGLYDFSWNSRENKVYDLVSSTGLTDPPLAWPVWDGRSSLAADPPTNTLTGIPGGGDSRRFFAVIERDAPLRNGSFESPVIDDGEIANLGLPWDVYNPDMVVTADVRTWNPTTTDYPSLAPGGGENVGYAYCSYITTPPDKAFGLSQTLGASFAANTSYEVAFMVGRPNGFGWPGYRVELLAGGTVIAVDDNTQSPTSGTFVGSTVFYTYDPGDAGLVGQPLAVRLLSRGEDPESAGPGEFEVDFDRVTFSSNRP
ncbi:hypothetical protein [Haloferula sp. A504]|uniref:hypothetical protein n=1 Tax=Haloferula sp. A504 TaxID=3373601 RepID=UPI0031BD08EF|nr:hypothetical protein [Verrucomicrobiaceae bacterium E54]